MKNLFSYHDSAMIAFVGDVWTVEDDGTDFYAVFDQHDEVNEGSNGAYVQRLVQLTARTTDVKDLTRESVVVAPNDNRYRVREVLSQDDGSLSLVAIVPVGSNEDCCE